MSKRLMLVLFLIVAAVVLLANSLFIVKPDQFAIVTEFGKPVDFIQKQGRCLQPEQFAGKTPSELPKDACTSYQALPAPGLYFKTPFVQDVRYLDSRIQGWRDEARNTKTRELREIDFTAFARWRIVDPLKFYEATAASGDPVLMVRSAMGHMDSVVTSRIQTRVREKKLASIVRDRGREFEARAELDLTQLIAEFVECLPENNKEIRSVLEEARSSTLHRASTDEEKAERSEIVEAIRRASNLQMQKEFGVSILDLHFKRINYSPAIHAAMVNEIKADRQRDIDMYKKVGDVCQGSIDQVKLERLGLITGERDREVRRIDGEARALAIGIKARAFNQDPEFFRFIKTLEVYENGLVDNTQLVLSSQSPLFYLLQDATILNVAKKRELAPLDHGAGLQMPDGTTDELTPQKRPRIKKTPKLVPPVEKAPKPTPTPEPAPTPEPVPAP
ncbi:MAG: membrane protease subunit HflC [Myxococcota bacterium]|jgi:membrane protease subunit HflC